jgi:hypothetical protein
MRKIQIPLSRYAHPEYLRELCNRVEQCYFSHDRDWSCIQAVFDVEIKAMLEREPRPPAEARGQRMAHSRVGKAARR